MYRKAGCKFLILFAASLFFQCSLIGSHKTIYTKAKKPIKKVAVILTAENDPFDRQTIESINLFLTRRLAEDFSQQKHFDFTILANEYVVNEKDDFEQTLIGVELAEYDAYILCFATRKSGGNFRVAFLVYETSPTQKLMTASHSTRFGNSYWMPPSYHQSLTDATEGAVEILMRHWEKIGANYQQ